MKMAVRQWARIPFPLALDDSGSVLAVKGTLRHFAPWTAAGRSGETRCSRGKRGISGRVDGPKGNLSVILAALSRSRGALSPPQGRSAA